MENSRKEQQFAVGEISDFEDDEFYGLCGDFEHSKAKTQEELRHEIGIAECAFSTFGEDTKECR